MKIYNSKSRPCIEYAMIFYFHEDKSHVLQTLQNKFLRIAYPCMQSTPIRSLEMISNFEPLNTRYNQLILRHWARAKYPSKHHTLHKLNNKWNIQRKEYKSTMNKNSPS